MADIAELGIRVDSAQVISAAQNLRDLAAAGGAAKAATDGIGNSSGEAAPKIRGAGDALEGAARSASVFTSSMAQGDSALQSLRVRLDENYAAHIRMRDGTNVLTAAFAAGKINLEDYNYNLALLENQSRVTTAAQSILEGQMRVTSASQVGLGTSAGLVSGQVGNMTAQFNDIGVMLAAGQSPFTLGIQQGTQLAQVINQVAGVGGAGAGLKAVGAALFSMVNPITLVTVGAITAGAALLNMWRGSGEEAEDYETKLDRITNLIDDATESVREFNQTSLQLGDEFGEANVAAAREMLAINRELAIVQAERAQRELNATSAGIVGTTVANYQSQFAGASSVMGEGIAGPESRDYMTDLAAVMGLGAQEAEYFSAALREINDEAATAQQVVGAYRDVLTVLRTATGDFKNMSETQESVIDQIRAGLESALGVAALSQAATNEAEQRLQVMENQNRVMALGLRYGEDSILVLRERNAQERAGLEAMLENESISGELADALRSAADERERLTEQEGLEAMRDRLRDIADEARQVSAETGKDMSVVINWAESLVERLDEAVVGTDDLNNTELGALESGMMSLASLAERMFEAVSGTKREIETISVEGQAAGLSANRVIVGPGSEQERIVREAVRLADELNISAAAILSIIDVESDYRPGIASSVNERTGQTYEGLFQFGDTESERYFGGPDAARNQSIEAQFAAFKQFLIERADSVDMSAYGLNDQQLYGTVQGGNPTKTNVGDANSGGMIDNVGRFVSSDPRWKQAQDDAQALLLAYADVETEVTGTNDRIRELAGEGMSAVAAGREGLITETTDFLSDLLTEEQEIEELRKRLNDLVEAGLLPQEKANDIIRETTEGTRSFKEEAAAVERILRQTETPLETYNRELAALTALYDAGSIGAEAFGRRAQQLQLDLTEAQANDPFAQAMEALREQDAEEQQARLEGISQGVSNFASSMGDAVANSQSLGDALSNMGDVVEDTFRRMASSWISNGIEQIMNHLLFGTQPGQQPTGLNGSGGGLISSLVGSVVGMASGQQGAVPVNVNVAGATGNTEVMQMVSQGVSAGLNSYSKGEASRINYYASDPRLR